MVFEGKICVPLEWCDRFTLDIHYLTMGYAIINDPYDREGLKTPQLLPSKLFHPVFANLNLGFYAGQATAKDGCSSVIDWKAAPELADAIRVWATKNNVAAQCSPLPAQLRDLARSLDLPMRFGRAIVRDLLLRVLRFVYDHVSVPALQSLGQTRPGMVKTVHQTIAMLAREEVFDRPSIAVPLPLLLDNKKSPARKTVNIDTTVQEDEDTNISIPTATTESKHEPSSKPVTLDDIYSLMTAILSKHKSDNYNNILNQLYSTAANQQSSLNDSFGAINEHEVRLDTCEETGTEMGQPEDE